MVRRRLWASVVAFGIFCLLLINFQSKETVIVQVAQLQPQQRVPLFQQKEVNEGRKEEKKILEEGVKDEEEDGEEKSFFIKDSNHGQTEKYPTDDSPKNTKKADIFPKILSPAEGKSLDPTQKGKDPDEPVKEESEDEAPLSASPPKKQEELMENIKLIEKNPRSNLLSGINFKGDIKTPKVNIEVNGHSINFTNVKPRETPQKIRIHLIFHSHVDPGWLKTFEEYYEEKVHSILSNAVEAMNNHTDLRFIWSETSFLERWWQDATEMEKTLIKNQIATGQLEISGGAWVMTDEATPTFYSAIENMIEGHKFIHQQFNITPKTSWSVDPFGHGAMMPELLHRAGVEAMVIGRFHDHIKQELRDKQSLKWRWIPPYFESLEGPKVNSLPHLVYTTEDAFEDHSVGICYHVGNSALYQARCPKRTLLNNMTEENVEFMTRRFVDQMRITQKMYGVEDLLVPIGDDFFFGDKTDWSQMYEGYSKMIEWLKKHPEANAEMRFSTVSDFFNAIKDEDLATLQGDFFPYTSNMNDPNPWWTGFFVHRPFAKTMERRLQNHLRTLDIISVLANSTRHIAMLETAKRALTLFQHHDGITGTSRPHVMRDYEKRMQYAFDIFSSTYINSLTGGNNSSFPGILTYNGGDNSYSVFDIPQGQKNYLSVFSSQTFPHKSLLKIYVKSAVKVETKEGKEISTQIRKRSDGNYEIQFFGDLAPLSITQFVLTPVEEIKKTEERPKCWKVNSETGEIEALLLGSTAFSFNISLFELKDNGGAYVFNSFGNRIYVSPKKSTDYSSFFQEVMFSDYPAKNLSMKVVCLGEGDISIEIYTNLTMMNSLLIEINTEIKQNSFHTDVNGMYHLKRKYQNLYNGEKIPIDANIFPVASSVFVEDESYRMTVATGQPTGATATRPGALELLVDRRTTNDDGKGLGYNDCFDNRPSNVRYRVFIEKRLPPSASKHSFLTLSAEEKIFETLYPPIVVTSLSPLPSALNLGPKSWPCSIQLISWRPLSDKISILILRKYNVDVNFVDKSCEQNSMDELYQYFSTRYHKFFHSKLSATEDGEEATGETFKKSLSSPFSIAAFRLYS